MNISTFIRHRVNTIQELSSISPEFGVEIDLRDFNGSIILNHEPFASGDSFQNYLKAYEKKTCILNTKVDGLEFQIIDLMRTHDIDNYFFLDTTIPSLVKLVNSGFTKISVRFSEYEPLEFVKKFEDKVQWVWVDCFTRNVLTRDTYEYLKSKFKICLVSPELHGHPLDRIADFKDELYGFELDAVCTKRPDLWK